MQGKDSYKNHPVYCAKKKKKRKQPHLLHKEKSLEKEPNQNSSIQPIML